MNALSKVGRWTLVRLNGQIVVDDVTLDEALAALRAELRIDPALRFKLRARGAR